MYKQGKYYDGTKLLSLKDINGCKPEIYMCTSNRTGGKTTYFNRLVVNRFKNGKGKFCVLYRFNYELDECAEKFFKDISTLFFKNDTMVSKRRASGIFHELFINDVSCGYALSLNAADQLKKFSHIFSDATSIIFDEFQSETNHYCADEVRKFISIHTSIARGNGEQTRYVPVFMLANPVSIINPYYVEMGISERLNDSVRYLRGDGFVLEQGFVDSASKAQKESGFNKAFARNSYTAYASESVYLNDSKSFIAKPTGRNIYIATIRYDGRDYGVREYTDLGIIYCDDRPDLSHKLKIVVNTSDHTINYVMLRRNDLFITNMRYFFERGCFRFKDLKCKSAILKVLSY